MFIDFWIEIYEAMKGKMSRSILTGIGIAWKTLFLTIY